MKKLLSFMAILLLAGCASENVKDLAYHMERDAVIANGEHNTVATARLVVATKEMAITLGEPNDIPSIEDFPITIQGIQDERGWLNRFVNWFADKTGYSIWEWLGCLGLIFSGVATGRWLIVYQALNALYSVLRGVETAKDPKVKLAIKKNADENGTLSFLNKILDKLGYRVKEAKK